MIEVSTYKRGSRVAAFYSTPYTDVVHVRNRTEGYCGVDMDGAETYATTFDSALCALCRDAAERDGMEFRAEHPIPKCSGCGEPYWGYIREQDRITIRGRACACMGSG